MSFQSAYGLGKALQTFAYELPKQVTRVAVSAGLGVMQKAMRGATPKGRTGNLRRSIKKRINRGGQSGKVGFDVGMKPDRRRGQHAHLYFMGTADRTRRRIGGRYRKVELKG
jgi:hypothetical protein